MSIPAVCGGEYNRKRSKTLLHPMLTNTAIGCNKKYSFILL